MAMISITIRIAREMYNEILDVKEKMENYYPWDVTVSDVVRIAIKDVIKKWQDY